MGRRLKTSVTYPLVFGTGLYAVLIGVVYFILSLSLFTPEHLTTPFLQFALRFALLICGGDYAVSAWVVCFVMIGIVFVTVLLLSSVYGEGRRKGLLYFGYVVGGVVAIVAVVTILLQQRSPFIAGKPSSFILGTAVFLSIISILVGSNCFVRSRVVKRK